MQTIEPLTESHSRIMPGAMDFVSRLKPVMAEFSFTHWGVTPLARPLSLDVYKAWLESGHHADMEYLERHLPQKEDPTKLAPKARSAIVVAKSYLPHPYPHEQAVKAKTAFYAQGEDYHFQFKEELELAARKLREMFAGEEFLCFTDSAPIMERDLAYRAGLGWVGKNTCLIHPRRGSLFFLGEIYTSVTGDDGGTPHVPDMCGTCDRCIKACPTGALESPRTLNANKCISYWTIESREIAPVDLREKFGAWFFGCDICQTVCPWNEKLHGKTHLNPDEPDCVEDLRWLLHASHREIQRTLFRSPLLRARALGLKRNALYVIGNLKLNDLKSDVVRLASQPGPLQELAHWTLGRLT